MDEEPADIILYHDLGILADIILRDCEDDVARLAEKLDGITAPKRDGLILSDFLNAYQVFYYFFRIDPDEITRERLILQPASELQYGIQIKEIELLELIFAVIDREAVILVSDGDRVLTRYTGRDAYTEGIRYIKSML